MLYHKKFPNYFLVIIAYVVTNVKQYLATTQETFMQLSERSKKGAHTVRPSRSNIRFFCHKAALPNTFLAVSTLSLASRQ